MKSPVIITRQEKEPFIGSDQFDSGKNLSLEWKNYLPAPERQKKGSFDTWNCVAFSALNTIETQMNEMIRNKRMSSRNIEWLTAMGYLQDGYVEFSDRFVGYTAGTKVGVGNSGSSVAYNIEKYGLVPESMWPFIEGTDEEDYYKRPPKSIFDIAIEFKTKFKITYGRVWADNRDEEIKKAPIQLYVNAWHKKYGLYYNPTESVNHAIMYYRGNTKQVFDHYEPFVKSLVNSYYYYPSGYRYNIEEIITLSLIHI